MSSRCDPTRGTNAVTGCLSRSRPIRPRSAHDSSRTSAYSLRQTPAFRCDKFPIIPRPTESGSRIPVRLPPLILLSAVPIRRVRIKYCRAKADKNWAVSWPPNRSDVQKSTRGWRRMGKHRDGVCHRCGWARPVSTVGRADRRRMGTGRAFGRLCDDCIDYLLCQRRADVGVHTPWRTKLLHRRDVA